MGQVIAGVVVDVACLASHLQARRSYLEGEKLVTSKSPQAAGRGSSLEDQESYTSPFGILHL